MNSTESQDGRHRLDKWLWHTRFFRSRALATQAVAGGKAKLNGERVKPAHELRVGDRLSITVGQETFEVDVLALPQRRGSASEASTCYGETPQSLALRASTRDQRRLAALVRPQPDVRPDKRQRRQLEKLRGRQG